MLAFKSGFNFDNFQFVLNNTNKVEIQMFFFFSIHLA